MVSKTIAIFSSVCYLVYFFMFVFYLFGFSKKIDDWFFCIFLSIFSISPVVLIKHIRNNRTAIISSIGFFEHEVKIKKYIQYIFLFSGLCLLYSVILFSANFMNIDQIRYNSESILSQLFATINMSISIYVIKFFMFGSRRLPLRSKPNN